MVPNLLPCPGMNTRRLPVCFALLVFAACTDSGSAGDVDRGPVGKADLVGSCAGSDGSDFCGGQSEGNCWCDDLCADFGDCCQDKAQTCDGGGGEFEPCGGKQCGDECNICPPDDPNCFETEVIKLCNAAGECNPEVPLCSIDVCAGCQGGCESTGCPDGFECVADPNECIPSACGCDTENGSCICTSDCGGGSCKPVSR